MARIFSIVLIMTISSLPPDTVMDAVMDDPHHDGFNEWGALDKALFTRPKHKKARKWNKVKRVSVTRKRVAVLDLLLSAPTEWERYTMSTGIVCGCKKGYASAVDNVCRYCRAKQYSAADKRKVSARDGMTLDQKDWLEKRKEWPRPPKAGTFKLLTNALNVNYIKPTED